jgi:hypothetical protein
MKVCHNEGFLADLAGLADLADLADLAESCQNLSASSFQHIKLESWISKFLS